MSADGPLSGLRIVDMTTSYTGPAPSMHLADPGADVVKVERLGIGDDATLRTLIGGSDVFMGNLNPGKLDFPDIGPVSLRAESPRLISCAMSGFGLDGPEADETPVSDVATLCDAPQRVKDGMVRVTDRLS
ncbi:CoA transferase [Streptosporangium sp. NPDC051023]|uniref:CoA transferase n=1 Tax=Streptosporangium sp. NPDC051023 TaxID=3155410 RepID=UPI00344B3C40